MTITLDIEPRVYRHARYTPEASYTTGGEAVVAADFKLSRLDELIVSGTGEGGYSFAWDPSAGKIKCFWVDTTVDGAALAEVTAATDVSGSPISVIAIGLP